MLPLYSVIFALFTISVMAAPLKSPVNVEKILIKEVQKASKREILERLEALLLYQVYVVKIEKKALLVNKEITLQEYNFETGLRQRHAKLYSDRDDEQKKLKEIITEMMDLEAFLKKEIDLGKSFLDNIHSSIREREKGKSFKLLPYVVDAALGKWIFGSDWKEKESISTLDALNRKKTEVSDRIKHLEDLLQDFKNSHPKYQQVQAEKNSQQGKLARVVNLAYGAMVYGRGLIDKGFGAVASYFSSPPAPAPQHKTLLQKEAEIKENIEKLSQALTRLRDEVKESRSVFIKNLEAGAIDEIKLAEKAAHLFPLTKCGRVSLSRCRKILIDRLKNFPLCPALAKNLSSLEDKKYITPKGSQKITDVTLDESAYLKASQEIKTCYGTVIAVEKRICPRSWIQKLTRKVIHQCDSHIQNFLKHNKCVCAGMTDQELKGCLADFYSPTQVKLKMVDSQLDKS